MTKKRNLLLASHKFLIDEHKFLELLEIFLRKLARVEYQSKLGPESWSTSSARRETL